MNISFARFMLFTIVISSLCAAVFFLLHLRLFWKDKQYKAVLLLLLYLSFLLVSFIIVVAKLYPICGF